MICSVCNESMMVPIVYGNPTQDLVYDAMMDKIVLGGTKIKPYTHFCHNCQITYPEIES